MTIDEAMKKCGGNKTAAAKLLGIPRTTLRDRLAATERPVVSEPTVDFLRARIRELEGQHITARKATGEALELMHSLNEAIQSVKPSPMVYKKQAKPSSPCTHVLQLTDLHYGSVVERDEVDGLNAYSPEIAEERLEILTNSIIAKTETQRHGYNVPNLHIIGTGDYISGGIHQELLVTNAFPEPVQTVKCGYALGAMFATFAAHFEQVTVDLVTLDNHGRLTKKPQAAQGGLNNWGYVVGEIARQYVKNVDNVDVNIHTKPSALITVGPERYLAFHGHQIKGWAGKPYYGFDRRAAMEAIKAMGIPERAFTKLLLGHFHHGMNGDTWILGGSLSGTDAFDHSCGRHSNPHQTSWFVHPAHGEFDWTRWWL